VKLSGIKFQKSSPIIFQLVYMQGKYDGQMDRVIRTGTSQECTCS